MSVFEISGMTIQSIKKQIDGMWNARGNYQFVYVSIGSQLNEVGVHFNNIGPGNNKRYETNSPNQMIPQFLRHRTDQSSLVIIIDTFNEQQLRINKRIINKLIDRNIDVLIINHYCTNTFLEEFIGMIVNKLIHHNIHERHFMICNFVKFLNNPNAMEERAELMIPKTIQSTLDRLEYNRYANCLYEWFGYRFYLYNFIYNYKKCRSSFISNHFINELETFMKCQCEDNMQSTVVIQNINTIRFWESIYDITTTYSENIGHGIATNLKDYLLENGQLESLIY